MVVVYHVTSPKKLKKYLERGYIKKPVRAWANPESAGKFSIQTGRPIILRLKIPVSSIKIDGHKRNELILDNDFVLPSTMLVTNNRK